MQKATVTLSKEDALRRLSARCSTSEQAPADLLRKMAQWGLDEQEQADVMQRLTEAHFVDEQRYAHAFVRDKFRYSGWGRMKIRQSLRMKGIAGTLADEALDEEITEQEYRDLLLHLLTTKLRSCKAKNNYDLRGKLFRFAQSRGFESDLIFDTMDRMQLPEDED